MNIIELSKQAGMSVHTDDRPYMEMLERFAALVRAQALEEAVGVCEEFDELRDYTPFDCAAAIRALKEDT